jgi:putative hydrolase of HD superfamily
MAVKKNLKADVNFLYEMGNIRLVDRTWKRFMNSGVANLAEHHFRVFWIAMAIAAHEKNVDTGKVAKLALLHDITESRTGDVDYLSRQYVVRNEELAIHDMLAGTSLEQEFMELWQEYETRESLESRIVKDADNLDIDFELAEQTATGHGSIKESKELMRRHVAGTKLYTKTAKIMWDQLRATDPHAWHREGRNRGNSGDWVKPT